MKIDLLLKRRFQNPLYYYHNYDNKKYVNISSKKNYKNHNEIISKCYLKILFTFRLRPTVQAGCPKDALAASLASLPLPNISKNINNNEYLNQRRVQIVVIVKL